MDGRPWELSQLPFVLSFYFIFSFLDVEFLFYGELMAYFLTFANTSLTTCNTKMICKCSKMLQILQLKWK